jgi:hypothetical protein
MHSTVGKVIIGALMVGAIVLTGGAALGALPAMSAMLGSVGISGAMASVLGGAISMGAVGAVTGGLGGLATGGGVFKGATKGFLVGAATGGVMGGVGAMGMGADGVFGAGGIGGLGHGSTVAAEAAKSAIGQLPSGLMNLEGGAISDVATKAALQTAGNLGTTVAPTAAKGLMGSVAPELIKAGGSIISGFAAGKGAAAASKDQLMAQRAEADRYAFNYGYKNEYANPKKDLVPTSQSKWYDYEPMDYADGFNSSLLRSAMAAGKPGGKYQIINGEVVFV